jgi:hypothetical protein
MTKPSSQQIHHVPQPQGCPGPQHLRQHADGRAVPGGGDQRPQGLADAGLGDADLARRCVKGACVSEGASGWVEPLGGEAFDPQQRFGLVLDEGRFGRA